MSTHAVRIIEIAEVRPHDNAERLEIIPCGGWQAVAKKGQFKVGDRAIYVEPDYIVPTDRPEFSFLAKDGRRTHRLRAVRLRGALSFGLLLEMPEALRHKSVGDDVMAELGIERYVPPMTRFSGGSDGYELPTDQAPKLFAPKFDLESLANWAHVLSDREPVIVTEKIDGANAGYSWCGDRLFMRSRTRWLRPDVDHFWSRSLVATPTIASMCADLPNHIFYGEVYGPVQSLKYGLSHPRFIGFAVMRPNGTWLDNSDCRRVFERHNVPFVPVIYEGPFDIDHIKSLAERDSQVGPNGHMMEGVVITPKNERRHDQLGRVALKHISTRFWLSDN